jgi:peptidoglycan/LPS O-acetylase OafA/YrhL
MYSQPKRIEFLDSIRGLAALFVLLGHTQGAFAWPAWFYLPAHWPFISIFTSGAEAVAMFFLLSGYVLSKPFVEIGPAPQRKIFLPTFYLRRFIRIWPPWFFAFTASILARKFLFFHPATQPAVSAGLAGFWQAGLTVPDFFRQCIFCLHDPARLLLMQDWSLGVELKGSALIPLFLICVRRKYVASIIPVIALFLIFVGTGHYYVTFIIGVLVAQYDSLLIARLGRLGRASRMALFVIGLLLYQGYDLFLKVFHGSHWAVKYGWVVTAIGCAVILVSVLGSQTLQRVLNHKPVVFLGRISYSVYLLQFIIILCLLPPLVKVFNQWGLTQPWVLFPVTMLTSVVATIGCAALMYRFVEMPVINFSHWLTKKIQLRIQK